jgi:acyl carrier protein
VLRIKIADVNDETAMRVTSSWDSLSHMVMVAAVETEYNITLSMDEMAEMTSLPSLRRVLVSHGVEFS